MAALAMLIGGTALSISDQHRLSEDLDFAVHGEKLPAREINALIRDLRKEGCVVEQTLHLASAQDFEESGLDLDDFQRDYAVDGVKVTFVAPEPEERAILREASPFQYEGISVADESTLFKLKSLLLTRRVTSRDLFDLYHLTHDRGRPLTQVFETIRHYHPTYPLESVKHRLLMTPIPPDDPGFDALVDVGITVDDMRAWFERQVTDLEVAEAEHIAAKLADENKNSDDAEPPAASPRR